MSRIAEALARSRESEFHQDRPADVEAPWHFESEVSAPRQAAVAELPAPWTFDAPDAREVRAESIAPSSVFTRGEDYAERLIGSEHLDPAMLAQFRRLGATLHQAQCENGVRSVMVASALPAEGKTLVASNLALVLSRSYGRRVLLIDGDLRRPGVHRAFGLNNNRGLADWLNDNRPVSPPTMEISSCLTVLTAGTAQADPLKIVVAPAMQRLLKEAAERYDWVILDTPPVGLLPDARMLAAMTDTCLMVIRSGKTPYTAIQSAIETIGRERIIGTVLNQADASQVTPYGEAYEGYYTELPETPLASTQ